MFKKISHKQLDLTNDGKLSWTNGPECTKSSSSLDIPGKSAFDEPEVLAGT